MRIRLSSIVVGVRNIGGAERSSGADIVYTRLGQLHQVRAKNCVLACYNMMIPYLCPEMSDQQKQGLHYMVKTPLVYTSVAIRNWRAFKALGFSQLYAPAGYFVTMRLNPLTNIGTYRSIGSVDEPTLVFMVRTPASRGSTNVRKTEPGARNCWQPRSKRSSAISATRWGACSAPAVSIRRGISLPSRSTAGRTATPMNSIPCSIRIGRPGRRRTR